MKRLVNWYGADGTPYEYKVFDLNTSWNNVPGNYIFARLGNDVWMPLYIGETSSFKDRLTDSHEKWPCARAQGVTHIHAHTGSEYSTIRQNEELNLILQHSPPCNG